MLGEFQKLQKICNKMSTRIFKIDGEMPEIIEPKVGNPKNSTNPNWANLSQPWNLTFLKDEIFKLFFSIICHKSTRMKNRPYWMVKKNPKHQEKSKKWSIRPFENTRYVLNTIGKSAPKYIETQGGQYVYNRFSRMWHTALLLLSIWGHGPVADQWGLTKPL